MNKFSYINVSSLDEALEHVNATVSETIQPNGPEFPSVFKAGGIDLLDLMKEGLSVPDKLVGIGNIPELGKMEFDEKDGLRIGANITLAQISEHSEVKSRFTALAQAAGKAATPQIRNMATLGGNLAQRTRCWYFRSKYHECYRKGSTACYARVGEHRYHAIMENEDCTSVHSSSVSTALIAFDAAVEIVGRGGTYKLINLRDFFVLPSDDSRRENVLAADEIITAVIIPTPKDGVKSHYIKMGERESNDWPIADVAVVAEMKGDKCKKANVALGAAAPVPIISESAGAVLKGAAIDEATADAAGKAAMESATPLPQNAYKVPIFETIIKRAILGLA